MLKLLHMSKCYMFRKRQNLCNLVPGNSLIYNTFNRRMTESIPAEERLLLYVVLMPI